MVDGESAGVPLGSRNDAEARVRFAIRIAARSFSVAVATAVAPGEAIRQLKGSEGAAG
jgi:tRNA(Leu) C34 or U34 (ribose-2'-O)-methylase TrmL